MRIKVWFLVGSLVLRLRVKKEEEEEVSPEKNVKIECRHQSTYLIEKELARASQIRPSQSSFAGASQICRTDDFFV